MARRRPSRSLSLVYDTAWFALRERARLEAGETVLVLGASAGSARRRCDVLARHYPGRKRQEQRPELDRAGRACRVIPMIRGEFDGRMERAYLAFACASMLA